MVSLPPIIKASRSIYRYILESVGMPQNNRIFVAHVLTPFQPSQILSDPFDVFGLLSTDCEHRRATLSLRHSGRAAKTKKGPRCQRQPNEEEDPYAALQKVVVVKDLSKRPMRQHQTHEELERNREKQPDEPD